MNAGKQGPCFMRMGDKMYRFLSCLIALTVLGFGIASCGPGSSGGGGGEGSSGGSEVTCDEAFGVVLSTGGDGTVSLTDPMTSQLFAVTVSDDAGSPLPDMDVLLFSNGANYFILAYDPGGFYGLDSFAGDLPTIPDVAVPIEIGLTVQAIPTGIKVLSFPGNPPNLLDSAWCGVGSFAEVCLTAEGLDSRFDLSLFFDPGANEIWLALAQALSEDFVENGIVSSFTGATTFTTFNIAGFPATIVIGDACPPGDVTSDDIRISLSWDNNSDIDLHVTDPNGEEIFFANPVSASGGELDFDARCASFPDGSRGGPEHVTWGPGEALVGEYIVEVNYWSECFNEGQTRFSMTIYVSGTKIFDTADAIINPADGKIFVTNFVVE